MSMKYIIGEGGSLRATSGMEDAWFPVQPGEEGAFVQSSAALSHTGLCWADRDSQVLDYARVEGGAYLASTEIHDSVYVSDAALLYCSIVKDQVTIYGTSEVRKSELRGTGAILDSVVADCALSGHVDVLFSTLKDCKIDGDVYIERCTLVGLTLDTTAECTLKNTTLINVDDKRLTVDPADILVINKKRQEVYVMDDTGTEWLTQGGKALDALDNYSVSTQSRVRKAVKNIRPAETEE